MHPIPKVDIAAFYQSDDVAAAIQAGAIDRRMALATVTLSKGQILEATAIYREAPSPNLVVVECRDDKARLIADLEALSVECLAETKVIVVGGVNDVDLYRELLGAGVSDYLLAPLDPMTFVEAVARCFHTSAHEKLGRIIAFIGAKGGTGSSTLAHNVAAAMAERGGSDVLLADLDLQFGTLGLDFDVDPPQGMVDVLEGADRVDSVLLERIAVKHSERLHLIPAATGFDRSFDLKEGDVERLLEVARSSSWTLVLDMPHLWTQWMKKALLATDEIVIAATPDLASMRNAKNMIEALKRIRPNDPPPWLVLNKVGTPKLQEIKPKDFAAAVGVADSILIPFDPKLFGKAANDGRMVIESAPSSKPAQVMVDLAAKVSGQKHKKSSKPFGIQTIMSAFKRPASRQKTRNQRNPEDNVP